MSHNPMGLRDLLQGYTSCAHYELRPVVEILVDGTFCFLTFAGFLTVSIARDKN
jgi:hypothetical protein